MKKFLDRIKVLTPKRVVVWLAIVTIIALVIETVVLSVLNTNTCKKTMDVLVSQVASILEGNDKDEEDLKESLKEEYRVRVKAVAKLIEDDEGSDQDINKLLNIANLMEVDEIHIFDTTGTIISGTEPKYYGYSFDSGEQMSYFKPMLNDKTLTMCQDVTANTAEGKQVMYAITWNSDKTEMIQIGVDPERLIDKMNSNDVSTVVSNMPQYQGYNIYVVDDINDEIVGSTDKNAVNQKPDYIGVKLSRDDYLNETYEIVNIDNFRTYVKCGKGQQYGIVITHSTKNDLGRYFTVLLIEFVYLLLAAIIIYKVFTRLIRSSAEQKKQLSILQSMSDIYYSMHMVNLIDDTLVEYKAQNEVKEVANHSYGASQTMIDTMKRVCQESYLNAVLEMTDIKSLPERMKGKKIITGEFVGKRIGWFEAAFIAIRSDVEGRPLEVMFTTRSIDEEKKKEAALIKTSNTDELTQLLNRRAYENDINDENILYRDLVYVALDINGLKRVNDTLGHAAGDELIIGAANCIRNTFEKYGDVYRTGGDEFVAILHLDLDRLEEAKKKLDETVNGWSGRLVDSLRISVGYVTKEDEECENIREMAILADKKMYQNKSEFYRKNGMDRRRR